MKLECAVCMFQGIPVNTKNAAVTIANGQAVCEEHFQHVASLQTSNGGQLALFTAGNPYGQST